MSHATPTTRLGAHCVDGGVQFAVFSQGAERVDLCLFDADGRQVQRTPLPHEHDGVWSGFLPGCTPGQQYGYRASGRYAPEEGLRFDDSKLLLDPYARQIVGSLRWHDALFTRAQPTKDDSQDSAPFVPKAIVTPPRHKPVAGGGVPWGETVFYETHSRGFTMRHPDVPESDRGKFRGLTNRQVLAYLKALGITTIDLLPVHFFVDESFLVDRGLVNYWGYNTLGFFAPMPRYANDDPVGEFIGMVNAIHDAGLEVILDVVYNHTAEGSGQGPTLSFRGLGNSAYYRLVDDNKTHYINDTGCGNTINMDHPRVQQLVLDSLRYWADDMGVDGFRFDLAPVLARRSDGFYRQHDFFDAIANDPVLHNKKLVAEPWDIGPGGYQLGNFPPPWAEWNDQYRDAIRRFWRGDRNSATFTRRLHGSADIFEARGRAPSASVNLVAAHDGFTTYDAVTYEHKHNEANGEHNRDGHNHNFTRNYGVEGETDDPAIVALRRRQRLNLLATLLLSQGTPMLLAGDEFGHTQRGNNNAYAQDNEITWLDWSRRELDSDFTEQIRLLLKLRRDLPLLRQERYLHGRRKTPAGRPNIEWLRPDGRTMTQHDWPHAAAFALILRETDVATAGAAVAVALLFNVAHADVPFRLPDMQAPGHWRQRFDSRADVDNLPSPTLGEFTCACWVYEHDAQPAPPRS